MSAVVPVKVSLSKKIRHEEMISQYFFYSFLMFFLSQNEEVKALCLATSGKRA